MKRDEWIVGEYSVRPAGKKGECFYCHSKVGAAHKADCVIRRRTVVVRMITEYVVAEPEDWTPENIEFHRNMSSWCSDNGLQEVECILEKSGGCSCNITKFEYVREATEQDEAADGVRVEDCES